MRHHPRLWRQVAKALAASFIANAGLVVPPAGAATAPAPPNAILRLMRQPRYAHARWNLLAVDLDSGKTLYSLDSERLAFTGSVRKLFSVGVALNALGAGHRFSTPVYRTGSVTKGVLQGNLVLVGAGDLTLGGRLRSQGTVAFADFDHNDANNLGTAILTPQDPLRGLDALARDVRASGIRAVRGDVVVDDRLFDPYRVPNGNLLITPILVNENMVDVSITPSSPAKPALLDWRPKTSAFLVRSSVRTVAGAPADITLSGNGRMQCDWRTVCSGSVAGTIPVGYRAPLSNSPTFVRTFRVEDPSSFARIAFVDALRRSGVNVSAPAVAPNRPSLLRARGSYRAQNLLARFTSPPYSEDAKLILKVSLNLGANLSLSLFGVKHGQRTLRGALAAERRTLQAMGIGARDFDFPTNGSGSPDSRAAPRAVVQLLRAMWKGPQSAAFRAALPVLGVDGSLATTGRDLPAKGHVSAKTGTTIDATGLKAQVLAGYIASKRGRHLAFALFVNDVGALRNIEDVAAVFTDEARITNVIYDSQ